MRRLSFVPSGWPYLYMPDDGNTGVVCTWANAQWLDPNSEFTLFGLLGRLASAGNFCFQFIYCLFHLPFIAIVILYYYIFTYYRNNYQYTLKCLIPVWYCPWIYTQVSSLLVNLYLDSQPSYTHIPSHMGIWVCGCVFSLPVLPFAKLVCHQV